MSEISQAKEEPSQALFLIPHGIHNCGHLKSCVSQNVAP